MADKTEMSIVVGVKLQDSEAKAKASKVGKDIADKVNSGGKDVNVGDNINKNLDKVKKNTFADSIKGKL